MKKIYFIRHGQSVANINKTHGGWADMPLTEQGRLDALRARKSLEGVKLDKVYSSDLIRAIDTQKIALPGVEGERTDLLREIDVGSIAGISFEQCAADYKDVYRESRENCDFSAFGGESYADLCVRAKEFLSMVERSGYDSVAAFSHGGFIQTVLNLVCDADIKSIKTICDNCSVTVFEFNGEMWKLKLWNYIGEL